MEKNIDKRKKVIISFIFLLWLLVSFVNIIFVRANNNIITISTDENVDFSFSEIPDFIEIGTRFFVPEATVKKDNETKKAISSITLPNGTSTMNPIIKLDRSGRYYISFYANFNGTIHKYVKPFNVGYFNNTLFEKDDLITICSNYEYNSETGILISAKKNGNAKYVLPLNVRDNVLGSSLIEFRILSSNTNIADFTKLNITLTDTIDRTNVLSIQLVDGLYNDNSAIRIRAGGKGQTLSGLNDGIIDQSFLGGTAINASFTNEEKIAIFYDNKGLELSALGGANGDNVALIADFNDSSFFKEDNFWSGFTNGEVEMNISFDGLTGETAQIHLLSICGNKLSGNTLDTVPPVIDIDYENSNGFVEVGYVGVPYPLYPVRSYDYGDQKELSVITSIHKNYGTSEMELCQDDIYENTFIPSSEGEYTIQYTSFDSSLNRTIKLVNFNVERYYPSPRLTLGFTMPKKINPGEEINVSLFETSGGQGNIITKIYLLNDYKKIELTSSFKAIEPGEYIIRYEMIDTTKTKEIVDYQITVNDTTKPLFISYPNIKNNILNGTTLNLDGLKAVYYDSLSKEVKEAETTIKLEYNGKTTTIGSDYLVSVDNNNDQIKLIYSSINPTTNETTIEEINLTVIKTFDNDEALHIERLFITENILTVTKYSDKTQFLMDTNFNSSIISYANCFVANGFQISFRFTEDDYNLINYSDIRINLTDKDNKDISVDFYISKRTSAYTTSFFGINKKDSIEITSSFFGNINKDFNIAYVASTKSIIDGNNARTLGIIDKTKYGSNFNGFTSNKVYVTIEMLGSTGDSALSIKTIGNQPITSTTGDYIAPQINKLGEIKNFVNQGETIIIPPAVATDAIKGELIPYVIVTSPSKNAIYRDYDISNGLSFVAEENGKYSVEYYATDGNETANLSYTITSRSTVLPTLTIDFNLESSSINQEITIPKPNINNIDENNYKLYVVVVTPNGSYENIDINTLKYTPSVKGKYRIKYYVRDEYYNYVFKEYEIEVQ